MEAILFILLFVFVIGLLIYFGMDHYKKLIYWVIVFVFLVLLIYVIGNYSTRSVVVTKIYSNTTTNTANVFYYLPESLIQVRCTVHVADKVITDSKFSLTTEIIPKTDTLFLLEYIPNLFSTDKIKFSTNSRGLLDTIETKTDDKLPEIISTIIDSLQITKDSIKTTKAADGKIIIAKNFFFTGLELLSKSSHDLIVNSDIKYVLKTDFTGKDNRDSDSRPRLDSTFCGILTCPLLTTKLLIEGSGPNNNSSEFNFAITLVDSYKRIIVPVERTPFVSRINKIKFQNGIINYYEVDNPSSMQRFISIPIDIWRSIVFPLGFPN